MVAAILPVLCLKNIFHHLSELDHQSQRTCVMLNRYWCSNLTSELWRNPFDFFLEDEKKVKLIDIYLKSLSRDVQKKLNLPMINKNYNKTAFNYPSFLHVFDPELILDFIRKWENKNMKFKKSTKVSKIMAKIKKPSKFSQIVKKILRKGNNNNNNNNNNNGNDNNNNNDNDDDDDDDDDDNKNTTTNNIFDRINYHNNNCNMIFEELIKHLIIYNGGIQKITFIGYHNFNFFKLPNATEIFSRTREISLYVGTSLEIKTLTNLIQSAILLFRINNIKTLDINFDNDDDDDEKGDIIKSLVEKFSQFIEQQRNLEIVKINCIVEEFYTLWKSISIHYKTLTKINFDGMDFNKDWAFPLDELEKFVNLEQLYITKCVNFKFKINPSLSLSSSLPLPPPPSSLLFSSSSPHFPTLSLSSSSPSSSSSPPSRRSPSSSPSSFSKLKIISIKFCDGFPSIFFNAVIAQSQKTFEILAYEGISDFYLFYFSDKNTNLAIKQLFCILR